MGLIAAIAFWMPNCSPHSLHETISVFGRWATSLGLSFTATGHRFSPGLNVFLYSSGISSINLPGSWYSRYLAGAKSSEVLTYETSFFPRFQFPVMPLRRTAAYRRTIMILLQLVIVDS